MVIAASNHSAKYMRADAALSANDVETVPVSRPTIARSRKIAASCICGYGHERRKARRAVMPGKGLARAIQAARQKRNGPGGGAPSRVLWTGNGPWSLGGKGTHLQHLTPLFVPCSRVRDARPSGTVSTVIWWYGDASVGIEAVQPRATRNLLKSMRNWCPGAGSSYRHCGLDRGQPVVALRN